MRKISALIPTAALLLAGCAGSTQTLQSDSMFQQTIPVCATESECDQAWEAARQWVAKTTPQGIGNSSATLIRSNEANIDAIRTEYDITVKKVSLGGAKHQILVDVWCNTLTSSCDDQLEMMLAFNKAIAQHVSSSQSKEILQIFTDDSDFNKLFSSYAQTLNDADLERHAQKYHLPATLVEGDQVRQFTTADEVVAYTQEAHKAMKESGIARAAVESQEILTSTDTSATINMVWGFYRADGELQFKQQATYNLLKVGKDWKILLVTLSKR